VERARRPLPLTLPFEGTRHRAIHGRLTPSKTFHLFPKRYCPSAHYPFKREQLACGLSEWTGSALREGLGRGRCAQEASAQDVP
jgi:hypothetical protein